jgi:hypothetical protein
MRAAEGEQLFRPGRLARREHDERFADLVVGRDSGFGDGGVPGERSLDVTRVHDMA